MTFIIDHRVVATEQDVAAFVKQQEQKGTWKKNRRESD